MTVVSIVFLQLQTDKHMYEAKILFNKCNQYKK